MIDLVVSDVVDEPSVSGGPITCCASRIGQNGNAS
jgi:hypothetical protein